MARGLCARNRNRRKVGKTCTDRGWWGDVPIVPEESETALRPEKALKTEHRPPSHGVDTPTPPSTIDAQLEALKQQLAENKAQLVQMSATSHQRNTSRPNPALHCEFISPTIGPGNDRAVTSVRKSVPKRIPPSKPKRVEDKVEEEGPPYEHQSYAGIGSNGEEVFVLWPHIDAPTLESVAALDDLLEKPEPLMAAVEDLCENADIAMYFGDSRDPLSRKARLAGWLQGTILARRPQKRRAPSFDIRFVDADTLYGLDLCHPDRPWLKEAGEFTFKEWLPFSHKANGRAR